MINSCCLCGSDAVFFTSNQRYSYHRCLNCTLIQQNRRPDPGDEKKRYLEHHNDAKDPGYRSYTEKILSAFGKHLSFKEPILNFGSGPNGLASDLLRAQEKVVFDYDPYFASEFRWNEQFYGSIFLIEVWEHIWDQASSMEQLISRLTSGAGLYIHSAFAPENPQEFSRWWYQEDLTHVSFMTDGVSQWITDHWNLDLIYSDRKNILIYRKK